MSPRHVPSSSTLGGIPISDGQATVGFVSVRLTDLPPNIAAVVRSARAELGDHPSQGRPKAVIDDPDLRQWVRDFADSGDLAAAIREVAADDPDLAG